MLPLVAYLTLLATAGPTDGGLSRFFRHHSKNAAVDTVVPCLPHPHRFTAGGRVVGLTVAFIIRSWVA